MGRKRPEADLAGRQNFDIWQARSSRPLTPDDRREITRNLTTFFQILTEWAHENDATDSPDLGSGSPSSGGKPSKMVGR
jgi:hypothetical protein